MSYRMLIRVAAGAAALASLVLTVSSAQADGVGITSCAGRWTTGTCVTSWKHGTGDPHIRRVPAPLSDTDVAESHHREQLWLALCRPKILQDRHGVERYVYAEPGCEYGRYR